MRGKKLFYWIGGIAGVALLILCALLLVAPLLINLDRMHRDIETRFRRETGGQCSFGKMALSFFPRPHAVVTKEIFLFPDGKALRSNPHRFIRNSCRSLKANFVYPIFN